MTSEEYTNLSIDLKKGSPCIFKLLWLLSIPVLLFLFAIAGYLKLVNFHVQIHSILMIGSIFIIYLLSLFY